jgi:hypothetical protein
VCWKRSERAESGQDIPPCIGQELRCSCEKDGEEKEAFEKVPIASASEGEGDPGQDEPDRKRRRKAKLKMRGDGSAG